jgi:hypothetical protein
MASRVRAAIRPGQRPFPFDLEQGSVSLRRKADQRPDRVIRVDGGTVQGVACHRKRREPGFAQVPARI